MASLTENKLINDLAGEHSIELTVPLVARKGTAGFRQEIYEPELGASPTETPCGEPKDTGLTLIRPEIRIIQHVLENRE